MIGPSDTSKTSGERHRRLLYLRVAITIAAWIALVVFAHSLAHAYEADLVRVLASPYAKLAATTLFLTTLVYFVFLSLPFLPNLRPRSVAVVLLWSGLLILGHSVSHEGFHEIRTNLIAMRGELGMVGLLIFASVYALALAMPFVPGVEIGLLIIALLGATGAAVASLATVVGLTLAFTVGRLLPEAKTRLLLKHVGVTAGEGQADTQMRKMMATLPRKGQMFLRLGSLLLEYRYLTLAAALNFPGNSALGGGGGLAMLCGMSRQFDWRNFVFTVMLATSPLPLLVLTGLLDIQPLLEHHGFLHNILARVEGVFIHN